jgi:hypothetical protein
MKTLGSLRWVSVLILLTGCAAFQTSTELYRGRAALLRGMPAAAITHFEQLTALDGNANYSQLHEERGPISGAPIMTPRNILRRAKLWKGRSR